ncbi:unnamed protein product [Adineta ricciae]|uniref:Uncharacterized protein n=1 Tax=Adineta ricciae TaxID=249248 RepID=A0A814KK41_ADIRI|nr:unnamed protein product [Adineta ricciae]
MALVNREANSNKISYERRLDHAWSCICCLLVVGIILMTMAISLIPVYLPDRSVAVNGQLFQYTFSVTYGTNYSSMNIAKAVNESMMISQLEKAYGLEGYISSISSVQFGTTTRLLNTGRRKGLFRLIPCERVPTLNGYQLHVRFVVNIPKYYNTVSKRDHFIHVVKDIIRNPRQNPDLVMYLSNSEVQNIKNEFCSFSPVSTLDPIITNTVVTFTDSPNTTSNQYTQFTTATDTSSSETSVSTTQTTTNTSTTTTTTTTTTELPPTCSTCRFNLVYTYTYRGRLLNGTDTKSCAAFCSGSYGRHPAMAISNTLNGGTYDCNVRANPPSGDCVNSYGDPTTYIGRFSIGPVGSRTPCNNRSGRFYCCCTPKSN